MAKGKKLIFACLFFFSLMVPTSAFATSNYDYSQQNDSFDQLFSFWFGDKATGYVGYKESDYYQDHWKDSDDDKDKDKYKEKDKHEDMTSADIWKDWYCWDDDDFDNWWK